MGGSHIRSLLCLLSMINSEEMNSLFSLRRTIPRHENAKSRTHPHFHNGSGNGELHPRSHSLGFQKGRASTAVRKLEEDVGVRLLHRTTRSVQLTEDGRVFHARARDLLADVDDLHSMFASDRVALRGRLRVDLPSELARTTIVPALPAFMATYPELELEVSIRIAKLIWFKRGLTAYCDLVPSGTRR